MADAVRAEIERDPERYRPETWSTEPIGHCPCCDQDVYRCTTRHTGWTEGFATHANVVHPRLTARGKLFAGCCCKPGQWGPKHKATAPTKAPRRKRAYSSRQIDAMADDGRLNSLAMEMAIDAGNDWPSMAGEHKDAWGELAIKKLRRARVKLRGLP